MSLAMPHGMERSLAILTASCISGRIIAALGAVIVRFPVPKREVRQPPARDCVFGNGDHGVPAAALVVEDKPGADRSGVVIIGPEPHGDNEVAASGRKSRADETVKLQRAP